MKIWLLRCNAPSHRCNGGCLRGGRGRPAAHHNHNVLASVPRGWQGNVHLAGIAPSKPLGNSSFSITTPLPPIIGCRAITKVPRVDVLFREETYSRKVL